MGEGTAATMADRATSEETRVDTKEIIADMEVVTKAARAILEEAMTGMKEVMVSGCESGYIEAAIV